MCVHILSDLLLYSVCQLPSGEKPLWETRLEMLESSRPSPPVMFTRLSATFASCFSTGAALRMG